MVSFSNTNFNFVMRKSSRESKKPDVFTFDGGLKATTSDEESDFEPQSIVKSKPAPTPKSILKKVSKTTKSDSEKGKLTASSLLALISGNEDLNTEVEGWAQLLQVQFQEI